MSKKFENPQSLLRIRTGWSPNTPCNAHSCLDCATRTGNKYWDRIAQMKAPGDNKKLTAIQFCNSGKKLFEVDKICAKLVTNVRDEITRISLISKFKESR